MLYYLLFSICLFFLPTRLMDWQSVNSEGILLWALWSIGLTYIVSLYIQKSIISPNHPAFSTHQLLNPFTRWWQRCMYPTRLCLYMPHHNIMDIMTQQGYTIINQNPRLGIWWQHPTHRDRTLTVSTSQLKSIDTDRLFKTPFVKQSQWLCKSDDLAHLATLLAKLSPILPQNKFVLNICHYPHEAAVINIKNSKNIENLLKQQLISIQSNPSLYPETFNIQETQKIMFNHIYNALDKHPNIFHSLFLNNASTNSQPCQLLSQTYALNDNSVIRSKKPRGTLLTEPEISQPLHYMYSLMIIIVCLTMIMLQQSSFNVISPPKKSRQLTYLPPSPPQKPMSEVQPKINALQQPELNNQKETKTLAEDIKTILQELKDNPKAQIKALDIIHHPEKHPLFTHQPSNNDEQKLQHDIRHYLLTLAEPTLHKNYQLIYHEYLQNIANKYPFSKNSDDDCNLNYLEQFFQNNGSFFQFLNQDLHNIFVFKNNSWKIAPWAEKIVDATLFTQATNTANLIQDLLFDIQKHHLDIHFQIIKNSPNALSINNKYKIKLSEEMNTAQVHWPHDFKGTWEVKGNHHTQKLQHPLAFFHVINQYKTSSNIDQNMNANILNSGEITVRSNRPINPLKVDIYQSFSMPSQIWQLKQHSS
ncbi:MAG: hypothetical protein ACON5A_04170 [Candidatus Comchoanobacterales bacterium]